MSIRFEDIEVKSPGRSNDSPIEVILFDGIGPDTSSLDRPCFYGKGKRSTEKGMSLVGYCHFRDGNYIRMSSEKRTGDGPTVCGFNIYRDAIHSINRLSVE